MLYDVIIAGGGPAGLAASLVLGRARKRVLLCDSGPRRNAAARHVQGFVTRDGVPPGEFRRIAREQLQPYPSVEVRDVAIGAIRAEGPGFIVTLDDTSLSTRRVLLCTGMVDVLPDLPGLAEVWGTSVFQCPYCHGWEVQDLPFGYLATKPLAIDWVPLLRGWSDDVTLFTDGRFDVTDAQREHLRAAGVMLEARRVERLVLRDGPDGAPSELAALRLTDGTEVPRRVLFYHPPQHQTSLVTGLGLSTDDNGFVVVDAMGQTSIPGIHAAGDLTTMMQSATMAAASGFRAAAAMNHELTVENVEKREM